MRPRYNPVPLEALFSIPVAKRPNTKIMSFPRPHRPLLRFRHPIPIPIPLF